MRHILLFFVLSAFIFSAGCTAVYAAVVPQELFISSAGQMQIHGGTVKMKNAANVIVVEIWGQRWIVLVDYATKLESAYGEKIKLEEIAEGHILEVKGRPISNKIGQIDASVIRDLSIETGTPSRVASGSLVDQLCVAQVMASLEKTKAEVQTKLTASAVSALSPKTPTPEPVEKSSPLSKTSAAKKSELSRYLDLWMKGSDVIWLQKFLLSKGYDIGNATATGLYGRGTLKAVQKFQTANGLPARGRVGPATKVLIEAQL
ncbi:peptidoglycan-binding protein [Candidatus Giovannonibacteria bacterium]|nr:peptidoglycan-binding protein [Candidatus Giovannonibacteria bacterium]